MPKMKTDRGAAKRFKVTGTGRFMQRKAFRHHLLEHKPSVAHPPARAKRRSRARRRAQVSRLLGL